MPPLADPSTPLYPIALDLRGRLCVVVGGGAVGARKARGLAECGASVTIVDPNLDAAETACRHVRARFEPCHLDGAFLAVAATDDPSVNHAVVVAGRERGILINQASAASTDTMDNDFVTMATVRRGELLVAITTRGAGPALSSRLRDELDTRFGPEWEPYVALLREMRERAKSTIPDAAERTVALRRLANADSIRAALAAGDPETARREALACLS